MMLIHIHLLLKIVDIALYVQLCFMMQKVNKNFL